MTDNCDKFHQGFSYNWPEANLLLCTFHILQQVWRKQYEGCRGIAKNDRIIITKLFWKLDNAEDIKNYVSANTVLFESNITNKYNLCVKYFEDLRIISEH